MYPTIFYRCPQCRYSDCYRSDKQCNECKKPMTPKKGTICHGCSLKLLRCFNCGDEIRNGNSYCEFYRNEQKSEIASAKIFFNSDEFPKYRTIVNQKFDDLISEFKDKINTDM